MGVLSPETRFINKTTDKMVLVMKDEHGNRRVGEKWAIEGGGHVDLGYRKGIGGMGPRVHFLVYPENRPHLVGPKIMPIELFDHARIEIAYKSGDGSVSAHYRDGAFLHFDRKNDTMVRRIGFFKWFGDVYDSVAKLGKCYYAPPGGPVLEDPAEAVGPVSPGSGQASAPADLMVVPQVVAPGEASTSARVQPPTPSPSLPAIAQGPPPTPLHTIVII